MDKWIKEINMKGERSRICNGQNWNKQIILFEYIIRYDK